MVEDRVEEGGRAGEHRDALAGDALEHRVDVEDRLRMDRGAGHQRGEPPGLVAEGVEERVDDQVAVAGPQADDVAPRLVGAQRRAVGLHDALRVPGGPGGEEDVGEVVGRHRRGAGVDLGRVDAVARRQERVPSRRCVGAERDDGAQLGQLGRDVDRRVQHPCVVGAEELAHRHEGACPAAAEDVAGLDALVAGVERDEHPAGEVDAERGRDPLPHVRRPDRDAIAWGDAGREVRGRGAAGDPLDLGPRHDRVAVVDRRRVAACGGGVRQQPRCRPELDVGACHGAPL